MWTTRKWDTIFFAMGKYLIRSRNLHELSSLVFAFFLGKTLSLVFQGLFNEEPMWTNKSIIEVHVKSGPPKAHYIKWTHGESSTPITDWLEQEEGLFIFYFVPRGNTILVITILSKYWASWSCRRGKGIDFPFRLQLNSGIQEPVIVLERIQMYFKPVAIEIWIKYGWDYIYV